jgi:hypothetical protein
VGSRFEGSIVVVVVVVENLVRVFPKCGGLYAGFARYEWSLMGVGNRTTLGPMERANWLYELGKCVGRSNLRVTILAGLKGNQESSTVVVFRIQEWGSNSFLKRYNDFSSLQVPAS